MIKSKETDKRPDFISLLYLLDLKLLLFVSLNALFFIVIAGTTRFVLWFIDINSFCKHGMREIILKGKIHC